MRIRKTGWVVWDKQRQKIYTRGGGMFVFSSEHVAWLAAHKERKGSPYKVIKVSIAIDPLKKKLQ